MESKLAKNFYISFWLNVIICTIGNILLVATSISLWIEYINAETEIYWFIMSVAMLLFLFILSVTVVVPHALDFKAAKRKKFESVTGTVARYKKVNHGGEPPTTSFYPIIKDSITGKELILKVNGAEINRRYTFIYLKHTKLALIKSTVD